METIDPAQVAKRLRAVMAHLNIETVLAFANAIGQERSAVSNWLNAGTSGNPPPVSQVVSIMKLIPGLTLDWLYTGKPDALPVALAIRLRALTEDMVIPESLPETPSQKAPNQGLASGRRRRNRQAI